MYFDGGNKASLYCNLRDHWKKLRTVVVSQMTLKTLGLAPELHRSSLDKCEFVLLSRRSAGPPLAQGPIRRNRSNRLKTGPGRKPSSGI